jgi:hypothetical protein
MRTDYDKKLKEFLHEHLPYEIDMFRWTYIQLQIPAPVMLRNALIESFCIHSRNLLEFFSGSHQAWPVTDFCDAHFTPLDKSRCQSPLTRISNQIAHLGKSRTSDPNRKINVTDPAIANLIEPEIGRFIKHLRPEDAPLLRGPTVPAIPTSG